MYVEPTLYYAATVWSPNILHSINKLESVQKRATRFIVKDYRRTSSIIRIFNSLSLKSISYLHTKMQLLVFYKIVHKLVELPLPDKSNRRNEHKFFLLQTIVDSL